MADKKATAKKSSETVWSTEERAAMRSAAQERKRSAKLSPEEVRLAGESDVQAAIAALGDEDREMAERIHELVLAAAPQLQPRTYYGMPAYAMDGKVICFFQARSKFKVRYSTFGFQPDASLDDGDLWPVAFAVMRLTPVVEKAITEQVRKAIG